MKEESCVAADNKISEIEAKVKLRSAIVELSEIAQAICRPGQSVEDLVEVLKLAQSNDIALEFLMDRIAQRARAQASKGTT